MYQPVALFIGLRYMRGRASDRFGRFVSGFLPSALRWGDGVGHRAVGDERFREGSGEQHPRPDAAGVGHQSAGSVNPQQLPASEVQKLQGVTRVAPLTTGDVVLQSARSVAVGVMLGVNPDEADPLTPYLVNVKQQQLQPGQYNIIIGEQLAGQLGVKRGDSLRVMVPSASQFTPMGRIPSQRLFTLIGTFHANSEVDGYQLLVNQQDASRLMRYPAGNITGWRLFLQQPLAVDTLSQQALPAGTVWKDWRDRKGELFRAVRMEKT